MVDKMTRIIITAVILFLFTGIIRSQDDGPYVYKPLKLDLDEKGDAYLRFLIWNQAWVTTNNLSDKEGRFQLSPSIRRARVIAYAQMSPRFLVFTHFGLNNLNSDNLTALGNDNDIPQLFLHGAWGEVKLNDHIYAGVGLHYWNGLTRLSSQSTISFMTLDQSRPFYAWPSLGITDQFVRHLGVYLKGAAGRFEYRLALNSPGKSPLGDGRDYSALFQADGQAVSALSYTGASSVDREGNSRGNTILAGYVKYNFLEGESIVLPYYSGTHFGKKKVLAVGTGFFWHPDGMFRATDQSHTSVFHVAGDIFLDIPVQGGALNAYLAFTSFDYGPGYLSRWAGTGNSIYGQLAYYYEKLSFMPYVAFSQGQFEGASDPIRSVNLGVNYFIQGHHAKVTLEWFHLTNDFRENGLDLEGLNKHSQLRMQLQVAL